MILNKTFQSIVAETAETLKDAGFQKNGLSFFRKRGSFADVINFQRSQYNTATKLDFFINVGVNPDALSNIEITEPIKVYEAWVNTRARSLVAAAPERYSLRIWKPASSVRQEVAFAIDEIIKVLDQITDIDRMIALTLHDSHAKRAHTYYVLERDEEALDTLRELSIAFPSQGSPFQN